MSNTDGANGNRGNARDESGGEILGIERRKALIGIGLALGLSLAAVALLGQITSYGKLWQALREANKIWLPLTLAGELVAYLGYVIAYRSVAATDGGPVLRYRDAARVVGLGLGAYVIGSEAGGLTVDYWAMRRAGAETHEAARRTLALNTLQAAGLAFLAVLGAIVVLAAGTPSHAAFVMAIIWAIVVPAATVGAAIVSDRRLAPDLLELPDDEERPHGLDVGAWLAWLGRKIRKGFADAIGGVVFVRHVLRHPRRYLGGVIGYPLFWIGDLFILWVALRAFGATTSPARLVVAEATAWAINFLPLPAGGSGVSEAAMAFTLNAVGVPLSQAVFAALVYRAVNFWLPVIPALALLPQVKRLRRELPERDRAPADERDPCTREGSRLGAAAQQRDDSQTVARLTREPAEAGPVAHRQRRRDGLRGGAERAEREEEPRSAGRDSGGGGAEKCGERRDHRSGGGCEHVPAPVGVRAPERPADPRPVRRHGAVQAQVEPPHANTCSGRRRPLDHRHPAAHRERRHDRVAELVQEGQQGKPEEQGRKECEHRLRPHRSPSMVAPISFGRIPGRGCCRFRPQRFSRARGRR